MSSSTRQGEVHHSHFNGQAKKSINKFGSVDDHHEVILEQILHKVGEHTVEAQANRQALSEGPSTWLVSSRRRQISSPS